MDMSKIRRNVFPTKEEIQENEQNYQKLITRINALKNEYNLIKASLRCRYCGGTYYADGYCAACYQRVKSGLSLERKGYPKHQTTKNHLSKIYERGFAPNTILSKCDFMEIVEHTGKLDVRSQKILICYFIKNLTLMEIGEQYSLSSERVRQIINTALRKCNLTWKKQK